MPFHKKKKEQKVPTNKKKFKLDKEAKKRIDAEFDDRYLSEYSNYDMELSEDNEEQAQGKIRKKHYLRKFVTVTVVLCILVMIGNLTVLLATGKLLFNEPKKRDYPIRGPIITEEMGKISWKKFAQQNIQMAYIRATKSAAYEDENFDVNWEDSAETSLPTGALHIFDPNIDGKEQAEHFINVVGSIDGRLLPAVEVKLDGFYKIIPVDYDEVTQKLVDYITVIKKHYGVSPIICCNSRTYEKIICNPNLFSRDSSENFKGCPIWYESLYSKPDENIDWNFWSYTNRVKFSYYESNDYLTMTVFKGSKEDFQKYFA